MGTTTGLTVRDARPSDAAALARLCEQLGYPTATDDVPARLGQIAAGGDARTLVAVSGEDVAGVETIHIRFTLNHTAPLAQLTLLVVDEGHRGRGVGRALVAAAEDWARERGCARIVVTTALQRADAHAFYEKIGYAHTGRRYMKDFPHS